MRQHCRSPICRKTKCRKKIWKCRIHLTPMTAPNAEVRCPPQVIATKY
jgi:hypothetical protein